MTKKVPHRVTLNDVQASLWEEVATACGVFVFRQGNTVGTCATQEDLAAAWELLVERFNEIVNSHLPPKEPHDY